MSWPCAATRCSRPGRISPAAPAASAGTGFVRIVSPGEEAALRANVAMQRALGARAEVIDAAGLKEVAPGLRADDVECAAWGAERRLRGRGGGGRRSAGRGAGARGAVPRAQPGRLAAHRRRPGNRRRTRRERDWRGRDHGQPGRRERWRPRVRGHGRPRGRGVVPAAAADRRSRPAHRDRAAPGRGAGRIRRVRAPRWPASTPQTRPISGRRPQVR